ncbi:MAG: helix-turn-helix domain-containing protein [Acidiferrobacterales bacterium]
MTGKPSPIAKRLKEARTRAGLSQRQLGIEAGIDAFSASPRINQYEKGKHMPDFATACRLAAVLGIPTPFLYAEDDVMAELLLLTGALSQRDLRKLLRELQRRTDGKSR